MKACHLLSFILSLGAAHSVLANSDTWTETGDGQWNRAGNWAEGSVPGAISTGGSNDVATFNTSAEVPITVDATRGLKNLAFDTEAGSFQFTDGHFYFQSGGGIDLLSTMTSAGQTETIATPITANGSFGISNASSAVLIITGTIDNRKVEAGTVIVSLGGTNTGPNTLDGVISDGATVATRIGKQGAGTWILSGANTYTGGTGISAGKLNVANTSGSGSGTGGVSVGGSGTLGGNGTILPGATNSVTVAGGAHIAPGAGFASFGTLTIDSSGSTAANILSMAPGSDFQFEIGPGGGTFAKEGNSTRLVIANSATGDVSFNENTINCQGTGTAGVYRLFDGLAHSTNTTWTGLTLGGTSGRQITAGLGVTNLASGLTGTLFVGDGGSFGSQAGDIYLEIVATPP